MCIIFVYIYIFCIFLDYENCRKSYFIKRMYGRFSLVFDITSNRNDGIGHLENNSFFAFRTTGRRLRVDYALYAA